MAEKRADSTDDRRVRVIVLASGDAQQDERAAGRVADPGAVRTVEHAADLREAVEATDIEAAVFETTLAALSRSLPSDASAAPSLRGRRPEQFSARPLYGRALTAVRAALDAAEVGSAPDLDPLRVTAEQIHTSLIQSNLLLLRALEPYKRFDLATHGVNVGIFAGKIAMGLDLAIDRTLDAIQAGLLHDIGMRRLPRHILEKEGTLTDEERAEMQQHPELGAQLIDQMGEEHRWLATAIRQEHERFDGSGYPQGIEGDAIDQLAQILGVADVFEACSHARSYRSPFTAYEALERVATMRGNAFSTDTVDALTNEISVFPLDSYVLLSTGEIGRVVSMNPDNLMRPTVEVLWDASWKPVPDPTRHALTERPEVAIERPLHESEVPIT